MNWIENITIINVCKQPSRCDRLPLVSQALSVVMYIQLVTGCSGLSVKDLFDAFIPAVPHFEWKPIFIYNAFRRPQMFL
jgi:hypothetical protein